MQDSLLLVPTELERNTLQVECPEAADEARWAAVETVGFGPVAAAARAGAWIARHRPRRVVLVGIAGGYEGDSGALVFGSVALDGVGAGEGDGFQPFPEFSFASDSPERLDLADTGPELLTVCSASADEAMATRRRARYPEAVAEDMEAFGVALSCREFGVPLTVIRGLSNRAGDRDHSRWTIDAALRAAGDAVLRMCTG